MVAATLRCGECFWFGPGNIPFLTLRLRVLRFNSPEGLHGDCASTTFRRDLFTGDGPARNFCHRVPGRHRRASSLSCSDEKGKPHALPIKSADESQVTLSVFPRPEFLFFCANLGHWPIAGDKQNFRVLEFLLEREVRNIHVLVFGCNQESAVRNRTHLFSLSPCLSASVVQRSCLSRYPTCLLSAFSMTSSFTRPTICSWTWPFLKISRVGIPRTP